MVKGIFGLIVLSFLLIFSLQSVSGLVREYNFNATFEGVNMFAYECTDSDVSPPPTNLQPTCSGTYATWTSITGDAGFDSSDNVDATSLTSVANKIPFQFFNTSLGISSSDISLINWTWEGELVGDNNNIRLYLYNYSSSSWVLFQRIYDGGITDLILSNSTTNISSFVSGNVTNMIIIPDSSTDEPDIYADFVKLEITYTPTVTTILSSPADLISSNSLTNYFICNSSVSSGDTLLNNTLYIWNADGSINGTNFTSISGTTNSSNTTYTFLSDGTYKWNCIVNSTSGSYDWADNRTITISTDSPSIVLNSPLNNTYFNRLTEIYLNYTATDSNGLSQCQIWNNIIGTWSLNQTQISTSGTMNFSSQNTSNDGVYLWNVWCNDTTDSSQFYTYNFTFTTDTTYPTANVTNVTTTAGSQTFTFDVLATDTNLFNCFYTIYNSSGGVDSATIENTSVSCTANDASETVSAIGTYNVTLWSNDSAGNQNHSSSVFTISSAPSSSGGGGGGGGTTVPVIALKQLIPGTLTISPITFSPLQRAIIYSKIRERCIPE